VLRSTDQIQLMVNQRTNAEQLREAAKSQGMLTLLESGLLKAAAGITSLEEVFGVSGQAAL